jgi:hypothetical protein
MLRALVVGEIAIRQAHVDVQDASTIVADDEEAVD